MDNYETFARTVNQHRAHGFDDVAQFSNRLHQLYNKIKNSRLTIYQKDRLLQSLDDILVTTSRHETDMVAV
jgi:hypothetical protein